MVSNDLKDMGYFDQKKKGKAVKTGKSPWGNQGQN
jgi:hypothetical protein